ncbi:unnamed protein product [Phytophthora lilii]|uniref:Unnamed protein product n=1 Tax=Phytophthora lilii TaxID=2077276 RepID=A0A9W6WRK9_9STRA|nr:unnamed protein product [Phytophthora lilii]
MCNTASALPCTELRRRLERAKFRSDHVGPITPPKGLDEEEFEYIQDLESRKEDSERRRQAQHEEDLAQFSKASTAGNARCCGSWLTVILLFDVDVVVARGAPKAAAGPVLSVQHLQKYPAKDDVKAVSKAKAPVVVVRAKRKVGKEKKTDSKLAESAKDQPVKKKQKVEEKETSKPPAANEKKPNTAALGLVAYGSDSDSDNDSTTS